MAAQADQQLVRGLPFHPMVDPDDMTNDMWKSVFKKSGILRGWIAKLVTGPNNKTQWVVTRAPKPVLELDDPSRGFYSVHDEDTFISVREIQQGLETALTYKAFSEKGVEFAINAGFNGITGGIKTELQKKKTNENSTDSKTTFSKMHVSYNIPRVSVDLNSQDLNKDNFVLSREIMSYLKTLGEEKQSSEEATEAAEKMPTNELTNDEKEKYRKFRKNFGGIFCLKVLLGGRLHSVQNVQVTEKSQSSTTKNELKFALTANIMSPVGGLGAGGHYGRGSEVSSTAQNTNLRGGISIEAQGGNPLVCWSPPDWVLSVGSYYNWRVIDQDSTWDLISMLHEWLLSIKEPADSPVMKGANILKDIKAKYELSQNKKHVGTPADVPTKGVPSKGIPTKGIPTKGMPAND